MEQEELTIKDMGQDELTLKIYNPAKEALNTLIKEKDLISIMSYEDEEGIKATKEYKKKLVSARTSFLSTTKKIREDAIAYQKAVLECDKKFLALITPVEEEIEGRINAVVEEKKRIENDAKFPDRLQTLLDIGYITNLAEEDALRDSLAEMDDKEFNSFVTTERERINAEKEAALEVERKRLEEEKERVAREAERIEMEKKHAEEKKELEKKHQEELEKERIATEERIRRSAEDAQEMERQAEEYKKNEEKMRQISIARDEKYQAWLLENGCTPETKEEFHIKDQGDRIVLYKKISEINLNKGSIL